MCWFCRSDENWDRERKSYVQTLRVWSVGNGEEQRRGESLICMWSILIVICDCDCGVVMVAFLLTVCVF